MSYEISEYKGRKCSCVGNHIIVESSALKLRRLSHRTESSTRRGYSLTKIIVTKSELVNIARISDSRKYTAMSPSEKHGGAIQTITTTLDGHNDALFEINQKVQYRQKYRIEWR